MKILHWKTLSHSLDQLMCCKTWTKIRTKSKSTLNIRGASYLSWTRSASWLLMPWLLASPGHQQPWYWLCITGRSLPYLRKDFNDLCHVNAEEWCKMWIYVYVPSENFLNKELRSKWYICVFFLAWCHQIVALVKMLVSYGKYFHQQSHESQKVILFRSRFNS